MTESAHVTQLLSAWRQGDAAALDKLSPLVIDELRRLAGKYMAGERAGHTLQPTALVNEAFVRLVDADVDYRDKGHFFVVAARMMRRTLVDHARAKHREKRGGNAIKITVLESQLGSDRQNPDEISVMELDDALSKLAQVDEPMAKAIELIFFGGLSYDETAELLGIGRSTLFEKVRYAKAWLKVAMDAQSA